MFTVYWDSVVIGLIFGMVLGFAIAFFSCWIVEKQLSKDSESKTDFSNGWESGYNYAKTLYKLEELKAKEERREK